MWVRDENHQADEKSMTTFFKIYSSIFFSFILRQNAQSTKVMAIMVRISNDTKEKSVLRSYRYPYGVPIFNISIPDG